MIIVHPLDYHLFDAMFNRNGDVGALMAKRDELHRRHDAGEKLADLVIEAREYVDRIAPTVPKIEHAKGTVTQ